MFSRGARAAGALHASRGSPCHSIGRPRWTPSWRTTKGITHRRYRDSLAAFQAWYVQSYDVAPDAKLLTDEEVRDYRAFLTGIKGYKAATVNAYLAPLRAIVRDQGRTLKVKGVRQTRPLIETLDGRDLGRLINAADGPDWQDKRDVALISVLARAGLRVSEALALKVGDVEINARSGVLLVRHGKGLKERPVPLSAEPGPRWAPISRCGRPKRGMTSSS